MKTKEVPQWMSTAMTSRCFNVEGVADKAEKEMLKKGCAASLSWSVQCFWLCNTVIYNGSIWSFILFAWIRQ